MLKITRTKPGIGSIVFEVTPECNLDCRYCYNTWKSPAGLPAEPPSYKHAISTLQRLFKVAHVSNITFTGGEPFLAERLPELVLFCRMAGKSVNLITNGSVAQPEDWEQMIDLGVDLFQLPLHSPDPDAHDKMTARRGTWEMSLNSIRFLRNLGARVVVVIVLTKINQPQIREHLLFLKSEGIEQIMLNRFNVGGRGIVFMQDLLVARDALQNAYSDANEMASKESLRISSNVCTPVCLLNPSSYPSIAFSACNPDPAKRPLTLDTSGNIRFCNHSPVIMGNIFNTSMQGILESDYAESWSSTVPSKCISCRLWSTCLGGCRAASEQIGEDLSQVDPILRFNSQK